MASNSKTPCDAPSLAEKIVISKIIDEGVAYPETLVDDWKALATHEQDLIDAIARRFYPHKDDLDERQNLTRALIIFGSITPEKYAWVSKLDHSFAEILKQKQLPPETI